MTIKGRIQAFQIVVALVVTAMAVTVLIELRTSNSYASRVQFSRQQLAATSQLAVYANRYSEQIAELLLIGEPERPDFDSARAQVSFAFAQLRQVTLREAAALREPQERDEEAVELARLDRMQALYREIDRAVERLLLIDQQGRHDDAVALFRSQIENRLDADFEELINEAVSDEEEEVRVIEAGMNSFIRQLTLGTLAALAILLAVTLVSGMLFARSIRRPVQALTRGAGAIKDGNLAYRIDYRGQDELGLLSTRFNAMAEQLGRQHAMLLGAQSELERKVTDRTVELAEANQRLTAADQHRVRFLADISHELRTPLTALRGEAEVALRGASKPEPIYRDALSTVVARAADIARLVEDLLFLARSEAEEIRFDMRRIDAMEVVREAVAEAVVLARERTIKVELDGSSALDDQAVAVRADERRLKQALLIPLDNALKYSDEGGVVQVLVRVCPADGVLEIAIRDQGIGIETDDIQHVFDRFFRSVDARERWHGGSGLGLSIARWIVEKHGGTIDLSSRLGQGTTTSIRLPLIG